MLLAAFNTRYAEFETANPTFVQAVLDEAATELNAAELGASYDTAHGLLAAHKMACSPYGTAARTLNDEGKTTYEVELANVFSRTVLGIFSA